MIKKDQFEFLFQKFKNFVIDLNDFTEKHRNAPKFIYGEYVKQNIYAVYRRPDIWNLYYIGSYVNRLADIKKFVEKYAQESLDYSDCISTVQKKYKNDKRRIKKDLNRFKEVVVYPGNYLGDEFEYIDSVAKQNIHLLKKWETSTSKDFVKGSENSIMNNEVRLNE